MKTIEKMSQEIQTEYKTVAAQEKAHIVMVREQLDEARRTVIYLAEINHQKGDEGRSKQLDKIDSQLLACMIVLNALIEKDKG
jgi:hypothetical protein